MKFPALIRPHASIAVAGVGDIAADVDVVRSTRIEIRGPIDLPVSIT